MNVLWIAWKDTGHPGAGGAEQVAYELGQRLLRDGHSLTLLTCGYGDAPKHEVVDGVTVHRIGTNRYTHSAQALRYYLKHLRNQADVVVEEVNGGNPYFALHFEKKARRFFLYHQLGSRNWTYEAPMPLSYIGKYILEPVASRIASLARVPVITISESTRQDLAKRGFKPENTHIISEGIEIEPVKDLSEVKKYSRPTLLSFGSMRAMKRTLDHITAFEIAKKSIPSLQLKLAGSSSGSYGAKVLAAIERSPYKKDITYFGPVSTERKVEIMRKAHLILQTAVEEGWGLTITEANSQGTPAVVYDVNGLRDSVRNNETGIITKETPEALAEGIVRALSDQAFYAKLQEAGWEWSKHITYDQSYEDFKKITELS